MNRATLIAELKCILAADLFVDLPPDHIGETDVLQVVAGLDSVSFAELRFACEQKYNIEVSDDEFSPENFRSLDRLASLIMSKLSPPGRI